MRVEDSGLRVDGFGFMFSDFGLRVDESHGGFRVRSHRIQDAVPGEEREAVIDSNTTERGSHLRIHLHNGHCVSWFQHLPRKSTLFFFFFMNL